MEDTRYSLEVCDVNGQSPICDRNNIGNVEVIGDVYIAARRGGGWFLNIAHSWGSIDAKSRCNDNMSFDGGRQSIFL